VRLLLDTHIYLWLVDDSSRLNLQARQKIEQAERVYVSSATIWEIAIKVNLKKLKVDPDVLIQEIARSGFEELPVLAKHAKVVAHMPRLHGDPFDRLLVAQAVAEGIYLLTADANLAAYSDLVVKV